MVSLAALWLPIVLSAVLVFVVSAAIWMALPYHRTDFGRIPEEDGVMGALRDRGMAPGNYSFPFAANSAEMNSDEYKVKATTGPVGFVFIQPNEARQSMAPLLVKAFVFYLFVGLFVAYVASRTLGAEAEYMTVFQITSTVAFMAHAGALYPQAIFFGLKWSSVWKTTFDALVYGLVTAGVFGWLWP